MCWGHNAVLMQLPIGLEAEFEGVIDLIRMQGIYFEGSNGEHVVVKRSRCSRRTFLPL